MKILILNWRDIKNPAGGGAEILTHELAKRWVKAGHEIIVFSSKFLGAKPTEVIDDVKFIRQGQWWNVHFLAFFYYIANRKNIDIIIDEVHWFPFFASLYARKKTIALTCEVASKLFFTIFPYPIALFFRNLEKVYLRIYKNVPTMTISKSTKDDLVKEGVKSNLITVLPMGINIPKNLKKYPKEKKPTFIYLARLNKQKGIFDAIEAFAIISHQSSVISPKFWVVGSGEKNIVREIKNLVKKHGLENDVKFYGFVSEKKKFELLGKAHILLVPSVHEGFGLTIPEAGSVGTPTIGYNVPGVRDIIKNNISGLLVQATPGNLAQGIEKILTSKKTYLSLCAKALTESKVYNWDNTANSAINVIKNVQR